MVYNSLLNRYPQVTSNGHISEEEQAADEWFVSSAGLLVHDIDVGGVEAESRGRQAVRHQVDPQQLNWDEGFRHTQGGCQEDTALRKEKLEGRNVNKDLN